MAEALERLGEDALALRQVERALDGYTAQVVPRAIGDAHRLIAVCCAKLGHRRRAAEHITEAQRLTESSGTPYALPRTLAAKAQILGSEPLKDRKSVV